MERLAWHIVRSTGWEQCNTDWYGGIRKGTVEVICFLGPVYRRMHIVRSTGWRLCNTDWYGGIRKRTVEVLYFQLSGAQGASRETGNTTGWAMASSEPCAMKLKKHMALRMPCTPPPYTSVHLRTPPYTSVPAPPAVSAPRNVLCQPQGMSCAHGESKAHGAWAARLPRPVCRRLPRDAKTAYPAGLCLPVRPVATG